MLLQKATQKPEPYPSSWKSSERGQTGPTDSTPYVRGRTWWGLYQLARVLGECQWHISVASKLAYPSSQSQRRSTRCWMGSWKPTPWKKPCRLGRSAGYRAALVLRFGPKYISTTAVNAVVDLKQRHLEPCEAFLDWVILAVDKQHFNYTPAQKQEDGYRLVYDAATVSHFGAGLKVDISKVIKTLMPY